MKYQKHVLIAAIQHFALNSSLNGKQQEVLLNYGTFAPKNFRSRERFRSLELSFLGTLAPWKFCSRERKFQEQTPLSEHVGNITNGRDANKLYNMSVPG